MAGDVLEVRIGTQELGSDVKARLSDDAVDGSTHGDPFPTQRAEQAGGSYMAVEAVEAGVARQPAAENPRWRR